MVGKDMSLMKCCQLQVGTVLKIRRSHPSATNRPSSQDPRVHTGCQWLQIEASLVSSLHLMTHLCLSLLLAVAEPRNFWLRNKAKPFDFKLKTDNKTRNSRLWWHKSVTQHPGGRGQVWNLRSAWAICESPSQ